MSVSDVESQSAGSWQAGSQTLPRLASRRDWEARYMEGLRVTDTIVVLGAVTVAQVIRFGEVNFREPWSVASYVGVSGVLAVLWLAFLVIFAPDLLV